MGLIKNGLIALLLIVIFVQISYIFGNLKSVYSFMWKYSGALLAIFFVVLLIWFVYACFDNEEQQQAPIVRVSSVSQRSQRSQRSRGSQIIGGPQIIERNSRSRVAVSPSRFSNVANTSIIVNRPTSQRKVSFAQQPKHFQKGHFLINNEQYEKMIQTQTKQAVEQLVRSKQYSKFTYKRNSRQYNRQTSQKSHEDMLNDVRQVILQDELNFNQDAIFEDN